MMGYMKEIFTQMQQVCENCTIGSCIGCKISVKMRDRRVIVNGENKKIEKVERIPNFA